jgi:hypothetical protein
MGNGIINFCIMQFCADTYGLTITKDDLIVEGDDGIIMEGVANPALIGLLGFKFSTSVSGARPGDTDMLRSRWKDGKRYLSIGRILSSIFWVKRSSGLKKSKLLYIQRCMGLSLHYLSPNHPVLSAVVHRIGKLTSGYNAFKGYEKYVNKWGFDVSAIKDMSYPKEFSVDESMRHAVVEGAEGFDPLPLASQLAIEDILLNDSSYELNFGNLLNGFSEVRENVEAYRVVEEDLKHQRPVDNQVKQLYDIFSDVFESDDIIRSSHQTQPPQNPSA